MERQSELKSARLLEIYSRLSQGAVLKKSELAQDFHVTPRSIQRDMEDLRCFFAERHLEQDVIYDGHLKGYRMVSRDSRRLTDSEVLAVCKILLESRSMVKEEMFPFWTNSSTTPCRRRTSGTCGRWWPTKSSTTSRPTMASTFWTRCGRWDRPCGISGSLRWSISG